MLDKNLVSSHLVMGSIARYSSRQGLCIDHIANDVLLVSDILGEELFIKLAALDSLKIAEDEDDSVDPDKFLSPDQFSNSKAKLDSDDAEAFSIFFRKNVLEEFTGKGHYKAPKGDSSALQREREDAIRSFYRKTFDTLKQNLPKTYRAKITTPSSRTFTLTKSDDPDFREGIELGSITKGEKITPSTNKDAIEEFKSLGVKDIDKGAFKKKRATGKTQEYINEDNGYILTQKDEGLFLDNPAILLSSENLKERLPEVMKDMFIYYIREGDGKTKLKQIMGDVYHGKTEKGEGKAQEGGDETHVMETFFVPRIDEVRSAQLGAKRSEGEDRTDIQPGEIDLGLIKELSDDSSITYRVLSKKPTGKGQRIVFTFPDLIEEGFLEKDQTYYMTIPKDIDIGIEEHTFEMPKSGKTPRGFRVVFKEQKERKGESILKNIRETGFNGSEIKKLTEKMVSGYLNHIRSLDISEMIEKFKGVVAVNNKVISEPETLRGLISETKEGCPTRFKEKIREHFIEQKELEREKDEEAKEFWLGAPELTALIMDGLGGKKESKLIESISSSFPEKSSSPALTKAFLTREVVKWVLGLMADDKTPLAKKAVFPWMVIAIDKIKDGSALEDLPGLKSTLTDIARKKGGKDLASYLVSLSEESLETAFKALRQAVFQKVYDLHRKGDPYIKRILRGQGYNKLIAKEVAYNKKTKELISALREALRSKDKPTITDILGPKKYTDAMHTEALKIEEVPDSVLDKFTEILKEERDKGLKRYRKENLKELFSKTAGDIYKEITTYTSRGSNLNKNIINIVFNGKKGAYNA